MLAVVVSRADSASVAIGERLLELGDWDEHGDDSRPESDGGGVVHRLSREGTVVAELRTFETLHLRLDRPDAAFSTTPDLLVFASRHAGDTGPLLTAHTTGNFGPAEYGGDDYALATAAPAALSHLRERFAALAPDGYEAAMECTHHGPTDVGCPSLFAELGSSEAEWTDPEGAEAVARAVRSLVGRDPQGERAVVGFGGGHYVRRFERVVTETDWSVGHVCADWGLEDMGDPESHRDVVAAAFERSGATRALLDGAADTDRFRALLADLGYEAVSETWLRETDGVSLETLGRVRERLGTIAEGVRLGAEAERDPEPLTVTTLPDRLLAACVGIDRDRTRALVADGTVAFATSENGTVPTGRVALGDGDREAIVAALLGVLAEKYDDVTREDGVVVARTRGFDPEKARTLGVSEGPAFGRLAAGESVEVTGRTIDPEMVESVTEERFPLE